MKQSYSTFYLRCLIPTREQGVGWVILLGVITRAMLLLLNTWAETGLQE